jgi:signal transduction histidine kinase
MIFDIILVTAVINVILGVLALTKGRSRLNFSFFMLSVLLAMWNFCVTMWQGYHLEAFSRINFLFVSLIPPAGMYFVMNLYNIKKPGRTHNLFYAISFISACYFLFTLATFAYPAINDAYGSYGNKVAILIYEFAALAAAFFVLVYHYPGIKFRQEKNRVKFVIIAFLILFFGGMIDFTSGLGWHGLKYTGNFANTLYAVIIFYAIFKHRLLDAGVLLRNFIDYTAVALVVGVLYSAATLALIGQVKVLIAVYFILSLLSVYFAGRLHDRVKLFMDSLGAGTPWKETEDSYRRIKGLNIAEEDKIFNMLFLVRESMEMETCVYIKEGDLFARKWSTNDSAFKDTVNARGFAVMAETIIRYETKDPAKTGILDLFGASIISPITYSGTVNAVLCGEKKEKDISFTSEEIGMLSDMSGTLAQYIKTHLLQQQLFEEENIKRAGLLASQMASGIKAPLDRLLNTAQSVAGKTENDAKNIHGITEEISRLAGIIDNWNEFSSGMKPEQKDGDIIRLAGGIAEFIKAQKPGISVELDKDEDELILNFDPGLIRRALTCIAVNSIEALERREKPAIKISVFEKEKSIDVSIRDNGPGIKSSDMAGLKKPFNTKKPKGTGFGLAISDRIIKAHGGNLKIESDGMSYTEVTLSIPTL